MADDELQRLAASVPAHVRDVCATLAKAGHQAVTVGGAVRDAILGRDPGDWDVATSASPETVVGLFRHTAPTGLKHGTVTVVTGRGEHTHVEVTTFRGEGAYTDGRRPDHVVFGVPLVEDLARRDLRVNAMAYDPISSELFDPFAGRADIAERILRAVGPTGNVYDDAVARFSEDGLRVMRAVRFAAQLEFALDPDTERGIGPALPVLAKVSKERISDELRKILASRQPSRALAIAERTGILALILPELVEGFAVWGAGDRRRALERWLAAIDAVDARDATLASSFGHVRFGTMLGELCAPDPEGRRLDRGAVQRATNVLKRLKVSNEEITAAATLVGATGIVAVEAWTEIEVRRLLADVTRPHAANAVAMWRARGAAMLAERAAAILARGDALAIGDLALSGKDLMTELKMAPGPDIGRVLVALLDRVLDDPAINTRERMLPLAQQLELELAR